MRVRHCYKPKGNKIKTTRFTVQGKPVLVCVCCLTLPIFDSWAGSENWDLSTGGERRGNEGRERRGFLQKFWLRNSDWREKQGPGLPPPRSPLLSPPPRRMRHPSSCRPPGKPFCAGPPGSAPREDGSQPSWAGLTSAFFTSVLRKPFQCPTASTLQAIAGPCPPSPRPRASRLGLVSLTFVQGRGAPLPPLAPLWGHPSLGHVSRSRNTQEDFEVPTLVRSSSSTLETDGG